MKVLVIVKASKQSEAGEMPSQQLLTEMGQFNEELVKAGILLSAEGLHPSSKGVRVRFSGKGRTATDGPFAETKELIAGFWLWNVKSMEEAVAWVKRCPNPMPEDSEIEIRPVFEPEDFGDSLTPELLAQEQRLRMQVAAGSLPAPRLENGRERLIVGLKGSYNLETRTEIPALWARVAPHLGKVPGQVGFDCYGVSWNATPAGEFDYLCGVEVKDTSDLPDGFTHVQLPATRYAIFTHRDHVSSVCNTFDAIWKEWLPRSGVKAAAAPCFERYADEFDPDTGMGGFEIWLPIEE